MILFMLLVMMMLLMVRIALLIMNLVSTLFDKFQMYAPILYMQLIGANLNLAGTDTQQRYLAKISRKGTQERYLSEKLILEEQNTLQKLRKPCDVTRKEFLHTCPQHLKVVSPCLCKPTDGEGPVAQVKATGQCGHVRKMKENERVGHRNCNCNLQKL